MEMQKKNGSIVWKHKTNKNDDKKRRQMTKKEGKMTTKKEGMTLASCTRGN